MRPNNLVMVLVLLWKRKSLVGLSQNLHKTFFNANIFGWARLTLYFQTLVKNLAYKALLLFVLVMKLNKSILSSKKTLWCLWSFGLALECTVVSSSTEEKRQFGYRAAARQSIEWIGLLEVGKMQWLTVIVFDEAGFEAFQFVACDDCLCLNINVALKSARNWNRKLRILSGSLNFSRVLRTYAWDFIVILFRSFCTLG